MNDCERFWSKVEIRAPGECWPWQGTMRSDGYGRFWMQGRYQRAHRVAWELANGPIPDGLIVCHACDNPPCCNAEHLWVGTDADNIADRKRKGRNNSCRGEKHGRAVLTRKDVDEIRKVYPDLNLRELSQRYGVAQTTVWNVLHGVTWS